MAERAAGGGGRTGPRLSFRRDASDIHSGAGGAGGKRDQINGAGTASSSNGLQTMRQFASEATASCSASSVRPRTTGSLQQQQQHPSVDGARRQVIGSIPPSSQRDSRFRQLLLSPAIKDESFSSSGKDRHQPHRLARNITVGDLRSTAARAASAAAASAEAASTSAAAAAAIEERLTKETVNGEASIIAPAGGRIIPRRGWEAGNAWGGRRGGVENRKVDSCRRSSMSDGVLGGVSSRLPFLETATACGEGELAHAQQQHRCSVGKVENSELSKLGISFGVSSLKGHRPYMEDEYKVIPNLEPDAGSDEFVGEARQQLHIEPTHFFGVFDGHAGGRCSKALTQNLAQTVSSEPDFSLELPSAMRKGFLKMNAEFLRRAERFCANDGSTAITAFVRGKRLVVGNVGDSRAVLCSGGRATALSVDHKPNRPEEHRRICALGGRVVYNFGIPRVNGILAVSRAFGDRNMKGFISAEPEIREHLLKRDDDYLVLATDGVWDVMTSQEACNVLDNCAPDVGPQACSEILTAASIRKGSLDNTTAMVIDLRGLWEENGVGAKALAHRRGTAAAAATSSPSVNRKQQQQPRASISSSNLSSLYYREGMSGGGGGNGGNVSNGKIADAGGGLGRLRASSQSMSWTLKANLGNSPRKEGINAPVTKEGGSSNGPPSGRPGGGGFGGGDSGKSGGGGGIRTAATVPGGGGLARTTSGIPQRKHFHPSMGQNRARRGQQSQQQQSTDGARYQRLSDWTSLAPRTWRVIAGSGSDSDSGGGGVGRRRLTGGIRGRDQGFAMSTPHHPSSTELAMSLYGGGRESSSGSASSSSGQV